MDFLCAAAAGAASQRFTNVGLMIYQGENTTTAATAASTSTRVCGVFMCTTAVCPQGSFRFIQDFCSVVVAFTAVERAVVVVFVERSQRCGENDCSLNGSMAEGD